MAIIVQNPLVLSPENGLSASQFSDIFLDGQHRDGFGRVRSSEVSTLFDTQAQYSAGPRDWSTLAAGTGAATHLPNESSVELSTGGAANGAQIIRQTKLCWRYQSGKSQQIFRTFLFGAAVANVRRRTGYFDENNGIFLEQTTTDLRWVARSATSGAPSDAVFAAQADWNQDRLDGSGASGLTLDITKTQLMFVDLQWLGVGRVRVGFFIDGRAILAHEFDFGNLLTTTYMTTANLPLRSEITNTGAAAGANTMKDICASVMSEGGDENFQRGNLNSASNGVSPIAVTTRRPVLSIRPALNFNGIPNRAWYIPIEALFRVATNDCFWEIVYGGALSGGGGPVWAAVAADSCVEKDITATTITGGVTVLSGFGLAGLGASSGQTVAEVAGRFPNSVDSLLGTQLGHSIVCTSFTGTSNVAATVNLREIY